MSVNDSIRSKCFLFSVETGTPWLNAVAAINKSAIGKTLELMTFNEMKGIPCFSTLHNVTYGTKDRIPSVNV
jgi:hypothetical protein